MYPFFFKPGRLTKWTVSGAFIVLILFWALFLETGPAERSESSSRELIEPSQGLSSAFSEAVTSGDLAEVVSEIEPPFRQGEEEGDRGIPTEPFPLAPEANYAVNDPQGVMSPVARIVGGAVELDRRELEPDAEGRPGRLRLMRADSFKYPLLRVEERFGTYANGQINPFPEILVSVADHVMLQVDPAWDEAAVEALVRSLGGQIRERLLRPGLVLMEVAEVHLDALPQAIASLGVQDGVRFAEPDWVVGHLGGVTPNDPDYPLLWGLPKIEAPLAWEITTGRRNVVVAVIDSGVDYTHPDLAANIFYNTAETVNNTDSDGNGFVDDIRGWDFYDNSNDPMDENRHGTHVAGTIAAVGNNGIGITGVAWDTRILPLRFLGAGGGGTNSGGINSIAYSTLMGVDMSNNSWGGGGFSQALYDTIAEARDAGILFVAASGNSGEAEPGYPARYGNAGLPHGLPPLDNIISVAASSNDGADSLASFSNLTAHIAAPGVGIYSAGLGHGYEPLSGTSMASPHVAGAAALLLAVQPDLHYLDLKNMLLDSVDDRSSDSKYQFYIHSQGRLNINTALRNLNIPIMIHTDTLMTDSGGDRAGNGVINPGETIELTLSLRSVGSIDATNVSATLSTSDSTYVTVSQATHSYGSFTRYQTTDNAQPFVFTVDAATPTPYVIPLALTITADEGGPWVEEIPLTVYTSVDAGGTVRNLDGTPFAGATVTYTGPFSGTATTASDGTFEFEMVDGTYKIFAEAPGYRRSPTRVHTAPPGLTDLNFVLGRSVISSSMTEIEASARPGGRVELTLDLGNSGNLPLHWQLRDAEYGFEFLENGLNDPSRPDLHWKEIRQEFGGTGTRIDWWDLFSPIPTTSAGVQTGWIGMDRWAHGPMSFDFEFPFYGQRFSSVRANNAGWLGFTSTNRSTAYNATRPMPDAGFMDYKIAFQWSLREAGRSDTSGPTHRKPNENYWHSNSGSQWDPFRDSQHAYAQNWDDHTWLFTWHQWGSPFTNTPPEFDTGQVELRSDGSIIIRYLDYERLPDSTDFTFGGPFIFSAGLQDGSATRGLNPIFKGSTPYNPTPGSVLIMRPEVAAAWIQPAQTAGTLASLEGQSTLIFTLDAGQLPPGVYESSIVIDSDDTTGNAALRIPVTFTVSDTAPSLVLTAPADDVTVEPGSDLTITAVFDGTGTPSGDVDLLNGNEVLATLPSTGGTYLWENLPGGFHQLTARVTLSGSGHTVYAPVRTVQAGKGLRVRLDSEDMPMFSESLVSNPAQLLQPPVISRNRVRAERFDITPVLLSAEEVSWWGSTANRDPNGRDGSFNIGHGGREIRLVTNNLRKHPLVYTVTPNTVLEFEFRSFNDPLDKNSFAYGIGLAASDSVASNRVFRLHGQRNWGINTYNGNYPFSNSLHSGRRPWKHYRIPVGQHYTGNMQHLVFVVESPDSNYNMYFRDVDAAFRNIRVYESTESDVFNYEWSFNDSQRGDTSDNIERSYFTPGTKEIAVTVTDGVYSATASRVLELPGSEAFRVAVNFQPVTAGTPAGFVPDTGQPFGDRGNDLSYGWDSNRSGQTRDDGWFVFYGTEQGVTRIRAGNGATWRMAVPDGMYTVTAHVGSSPESSNNLLHFNGQTLIDANVGLHGYAQGSLTLPVSDGEIVISSHRNTASLQFLEINRVDDLQRPPVASFILNPQLGYVPLPLQFDASGSFDSDGSIVSYAWDFGDGFTGSGMESSHTYSQTGIYEVTLEVTDNDGLTGQTTLSVVVVEPGQAAVWVSPATLTLTEGDEAVFSAFVSSFPSPAYQWRKNGVDIAGATASTFTIPSVLVSDTGEYTVRVSNGIEDDLESLASLLTVNLPPPTVVIESPVSGTTFTEGDLVALSGTATDTVDGDITTVATWTSSLDGALGTGGSLNTTTLSIGSHTITFAVTNSGGVSNSADISLTVEPVPPDTYTMVIDFGKSGQETNAPGYWNNVTGSGDWSNNITLSSSLVRHADGVPTGVSLKMERVDPGARAGIGGLDLTVGEQDGDAAFTVSGSIPGSAQRDIAFFSADGRAQLVFENLDDTKIYQLEFQTLHTSTTAAANWTVQPGTGHEQVRLISRNKGATHYSPVQVFENIQTDGEGRIILRSAGDIAQNINALELTALAGGIPPPPSVSIISPDDNTIVTQGDAVSFSGTATDAEDDDTLLLASATWTSDRDGPLGTGGGVSTTTLSVGTHIITFAVTNSGGGSDAASITLIVESAEEDLVLVRYTFENVAEIGIQHSTGTFIRQADAVNVAAEITASPFAIGNHSNHNARVIATDSVNGIAGAAQIAGIESNLFQWEAGASGNPYYEFTVDGATALESLRMVARSGSQWNNTGAFLNYEAHRQAEISVRSSLDNYGANIGSVFMAGNAGAFAEQIIDLSGLEPDGQAVTFRIYPRSPNAEDTWYRVQVDQVEVTGTVSAPPEDLYDLWVVENEIVGGPEDRTNGVPNLLRYALGGTADSSAADFRLTTHRTASGITLSFPRIDDSRITYEIWSSTDLQDWGESPVWSGQGAGVGEMQMEIDRDRLFWKLRVWRE